MKPYYRAGTWNCICDVCGFQFKSDELQRRWDGKMVCKKDFELRQPLDFLRVYPEERGLPWVRPESIDDTIYVCYLEASQGLADIGEADCARADIVVGGTFE